MYCWVSFIFSIYMHISVETIYIRPSFNANLLSKISVTQKNICTKNLKLCKNFVQLQLKYEETIKKNIYNQLPKWIYKYNQWKKKSSYVVICLCFAQWHSNIGLQCFTYFPVLQWKDCIMSTMNVASCSAGALKIKLEILKKSESMRLNLHNTLT